MLYYRIISEKILRLAATFPALVLTGSRQVGKTTLLRELFPKYGYVSLDSYQNAELAENDPKLFLSNFPSPIIIDEVQYAPKLFRHLKQVIDENRQQNGQYILTGSQKFVLMKEVSDSLAGRAALLELEGLCAVELGQQLQEALAQHSPYHVLTRGMFPQLWQNRDIPHLDYYRSYVATYIERDVRQILNISSLRDFDRFLRALAARNGQLLNKSELAKDVGVTSKTISQWLSVLEASNQISLLEPYFTNLTKRIVKSPRLFLNDTGLLCYLLGLSEQALTTYSAIGFIWESYVFAELRKLREAYAPHASLWFYRDSQGIEVDFIIAVDGKLSLIEVKWTELVTERHEQNLEKVHEIFGESVKSKQLIGRSAQSFITKKGTLVSNGFELTNDLFNLT